jgi:ribosomal subunit interface protein
MNINIKTTLIDLTPSIEEAINEKIGGLEKYFDNIIVCDVEVGKTSEHHHKGDIYKAEVNLEVPGKILRATVVTDDLYKSINEVRDTLKLEITKYKETL